MRRVLCVLLMAMLTWTGSALAYGGRACACDPDPARGEIGGAPAGQGWVQSPGGVWVPPEFARSVAQVRSQVTVRGVFEAVKLYRDIALWLAGAVATGGILYGWWRGDISTNELTAMLRRHLEGQGWELPAP